MASCSGRSPLGTARRSRCSGDITAGLTTQSARDLATQLRLGTLPVNLRLISEKPLSVHG